MGVGLSFKLKILARRLNMFAMEALNLEAGFLDVGIDQAMDLWI